MLFDAKNRKLIINGNAINLTGTETPGIAYFCIFSKRNHRAKQATKRHMGG